MPIRGRTPKECFDRFRGHVAGLIATVLGPTHHVTMSKRQGDDGMRNLLLGPYGSNYVSLRTRGPEPVYFYLAQHLVVEPCPDGFQLKTREYWYKVFDVQPHLGDEPLFRWEYTSDVPDGKQWCRHHFQVGKVSNDGGPRKAVELSLGSRTVDLNRIHTPTGFVLMEYVFRFLFTELEVIPETEDWERVLAESESAFFNDFSSKTSKP